MHRTPRICLIVLFVSLVLPSLAQSTKPGERRDLQLRDGRNLKDVEIIRADGESLWVMSGKTLTAVKKRDIFSDRPAGFSESTPEVAPPTEQAPRSEKKVDTPDSEASSATERVAPTTPPSATPEPAIAPASNDEDSSDAVPLLVVSVLISFGVIGWLFVRFRTVSARSAELEKRYKPIIDIDTALAERQAELDASAQSAVEKTQELLKLNGELVSLKKTLATYELEGEMVACGHYKPQFPFTVSEEYKEAITAIRERQREMIKEQKAATCPHTWTINGSQAEGKKATKRTLRLLLRAFNGECDAIIAGVSWSNVDRMHDRMQSAFEGINKLGESYMCSISYDYYTLKRKELGLTYEYEAKRQKEKEEQRALRERMRDEEKARREMEDALKQAARDEERAKEALEKARAEVARATGEKETELRTKIQQLEDRLREAETNRERAKSRAEQTRSGHVYIISNIGSFGETVFKIGMTRRLDPMERVYELGDASVPFDFDIHGMIYTDDAPALEAKLHDHFGDKRVNLVNERKEFFHVSIEEIQAAVRVHGADVSLTLLAEAREYRETLERRRVAS